MVAPTRERDDKQKDRDKEINCERSTSSESAAGSKRIGQDRDVRLSHSS